jgi:DNA-binding NtrC family response regulator
MARVLVVDDESVFRFSLAQRLRLRGYEVAEAGDGAEAVRAVGQDPEIDVVILDYKMPGMRGEQVLREIKGSRPAAAVIMLTAFGVERAPGVWSCLQKPCDLDELIQAVESARTGGRSKTDQRGDHGQ